MAVNRLTDTDNTGKYTAL